ncbi:hypothetical protein PENSTE_c006G05762 [Penicillium steckii]|uniref:Uncharacterized protein n=1 Tax=Penicillium steckii TaxID=303698 RepID=A0A1V6THE2_9EURO|nr:hypothetical protein PENSTE_c006G05762 [Penicillium steckii]
MSLKTIADDVALPAALAEVAEIGFDFEWDEETDETHGCDFEPYKEFEAPEETAEWFRQWTGNDEADGFWIIRPGVDVTTQPVVYIDSDGELGVIARNLDDLLWLFANGSGPAKAFSDPGRETQRSGTQQD